MSELLDRVRNGLECCVLRDPDDHLRCGECPYNPHAISNEPCANGLKFNALALIRQQQERIKELEAAPIHRLLTLEDIWALPLGAVIWLEDKAVDEDGITDISLHPVMRSVCCGDAVLCDGESQTEIDTITLEPDECGSMERYWSARPTDEQREAVEWDE